MEHLKALSRYRAEYHRNCVLANKVWRYQLKEAHNARYVKMADSSKLRNAVMCKVEATSYFGIHVLSFPNMQEFKPLPLSKIQWV